MYVQKAEKKGRAKEEVDTVTCWLTGYDEHGLRAQIDKEVDFETFFPEAPQINPAENAIGQAASVVRYPSKWHALAVYFYGAAAIAYDRVRLNESAEVYTSIAEEVCSDITASLLKNVEEVRAVITQALKLRNARNIKVKQPLSILYLDKEFEADPVRTASKRALDSAQPYSYNSDEIAGRRFAYKTVKVIIH